jgi:putative sterol carrier protein
VIQNARVRHILRRHEVADPKLTREGGPIDRGSRGATGIGKRMARSGESTKKARTDATSTFFKELADRGHEPFLHAARGTVRFDLREGGRVEPWFVSVEEGGVRVSHRQSKADAVVRTDRELFDDVVTGKVNALAATLRGLLVVEGNLGLVLSLGRLFPATPIPRRTAAPGGSEGGQDER